MCDIDNPIFKDENKAREHLEVIRWPNGPVCPHCGGVERNSLLQGKAHRPGLYFCGDCRKQFTVTIGTLFERSKIPLHKWVLATHLMCSSKKGISAHQLHRMLGVTYKTAWFMAHRIRESMRSNDLSPFGQNGGAVEVDETFIGKKAQKTKTQRGYDHKNKILSLVDRETKQVRSVVVNDLKITTLITILKANIAREAKVMTDEATHYKNLNKHFSKHGAVMHSAEEWVYAFDRTIHTNTIEGYFSIFKRGMKGVYQHCGKKHLHRYLAEFDFRYSNRAKLGVSDAERALKALQGIEGKRLTYKPMCSGS